MEAAARGHRTLSQGQGAELNWALKPEVLQPRDVINIFRQKTAPAFEVALRVGAIYAGIEDDIWDFISSYSDALGIAYQIRDDLDDFFGTVDSHDLRDLRITGPTFTMATR